MGLRLVGRNDDWDGKGQGDCGSGAAMTVGMANEKEIAALGPQ